MNIQQIKKNLDSDYHAIPPHWVMDWLLHVINKPNSFLITDSDYQLTDDEQAKFNQGIQQMKTGTPLAYLVGKQAFWSLEFMVNEHTLIPRPDTEVLVETVLNWINAKQYDEKTECKLLDLGTGSGCIAISLAYELAKPAYATQHWQVTAVDMSEGALAVAKQNIQLNNVDNVQLLQSSWYDELPTDSKFEVIVSNPPYIDPTDTHLTDLSAEPITALTADNHGLADIEHIVAHGRDYLQAGGLLAIEHGHDQGQAVREIFAHHGFSNVKTVKDYGGNDRVTLGNS